jgi:hypothetical protein
MPSFEGLRWEMWELDVMVSECKVRDLGYTPSHFREGVVSIGIFE